MQPQHFNAGATIFRAGDPSVAIYIIQDGEVAIDVDGIEVVRLHAGELFGESGVLEARPRSATATALTSTTLLVTEAETFIGAFGMNNQRALALVKLLCSRLRNTTARAAHAGHLTHSADEPEAPITLYPDDDRLTTDYRVMPVDVLHLPFQVGNRFGGEAVPVASNRSIVIPAHGRTEFASPHFEIVRRDGRLGIRDLGSAAGTIVNGVPINRMTTTSFAGLRAGENTVIAGTAHSPFRFRIYIRPEPG